MAKCSTIGTQSIVGGKEITFEDRSAIYFPNLARLCNDYGFRVIETVHLDVEEPSKAFTLVRSDCSSLENDSSSPCFPCLSYLDVYAEENMVDILHGDLFTEDGQQQLQQA